MTTTKRWLIALSLSLPLHASAQTLLVPAPGLARERLEVLLARRHEAEAFTSYWLRHRLQTAQTERLKELFERAEMARLQDGVEEAQIAYEMVYAARIEADWDAPAQSLIREACLRRAELATAILERDQWLSIAAALHSPEPLDKNRFSSQLIELYHQSVKSLKPERVNLSTWFPWADFLLVDGRLYPVTRSTRVSRDELLHRFTLISNRYAPVTEHLSWSNLGNWKPQLTPLVSGSCADPKWHKSLASVVVKEALWPDQDCTRNHGQETTSTLSGLRPQASPDSRLGGTESLAARLNAGPSPPPKPEAHPTWFSSRRLVWIGAGLLATALAIQHQRQLAESPAPPPERDGF